MWNKDTRDFTAHVEDNLDMGDEIKTGFTENFYATANNELQSGLSISRFIQESPIREQQSALRKMARTDPNVSAFRTVEINGDGRAIISYDYDAMAQHYIAQGDDTIVPFEEIRATTQMATKQADENQKRTAERATGIGTVGSFAGAIATQVAEPVNYAVVIPGVGAASALGTKILAGTGAGLIAEAIIQPHVQEWKNANDIEYTDEDVMFAMGASAVFGGVMGAAGHYIGNMIKKLRSESDKIPADARGSRADEKEAYDSAADSLDGLHKEVSGLETIDPDIPLRDKLRRVDDEVREMQESSPHMTAKAPDTNSRTDISQEMAEFEMALGVKRTKPETAEGVDVDPNALDVITFDESKFNFEIDGMRATDVVRNTDAEIRKMEETIRCMMGG